jgi:chemotaxis signal transduction protein
MTMTTPIEAPDAVQYLSFSVGEEEYGLPVLAVREILEYEHVTRVPRTPDYIRGVINLRGRVVPVLDLAVRFGLTQASVTRRSCVVIVEVMAGGEPLVMGLMVDAVHQVLELAAADIEAPPSFGTRADIRYLRGLGHSGPRFVLLLDIERVCADAEDRTEAAAAASDPEQGLGTRAAAGVLAVALVLLCGTSSRAGDPIQDNSFLIEEAYNQERGVVQHINTFWRTRSTGDWAYTFTQEWPLPDVTHQLSVTLPVQQLHGAAAARTGIGDVALNYRYQAVGDGSATLAFSPRVSLLLPTGRSSESLGSGGVGLQVNLPVSWVVGRRLVTHGNAGLTRTFSARDAARDRAATTSYALGQSLVWLARPHANVMAEALWVRAQSVAGPSVTVRSDSLYVSPGLRWAHDFKSGLQIVPGVAFPIGIGPSRGQRGVFLYLSLEHPFRSASDVASSGTGRP